MFELIFSFAMLTSLLRMATPLVFAALGGLIGERSGIVQLGLEAYLLAGAFTAATLAYYLNNPWIAFFAAGFAASVIGFLYGILSVRFKVNQIVACMAINLLVMGLLPMICKILFNSTGSSPSLEISQRFENEPMILIFVFGLIVTYFYSRTQGGMWIQFAGEHPVALRTQGVSPERVRLSACTLAGFLAGLGGASLSLFLSSQYTSDMAGGRGYIALSTVIIGRWKPIPTFVACLLFAFFDALQIRLQGVTFGDVKIPVQFVQALPYLFTLLVISGILPSSQAPRFLGKDDRGR